MNKINYLIKKIYFIFIGDKDRMINLRINRLQKNGAKIGNNVRVFSEIGGSEPYLMEIGDSVVISTNVEFITHDNAIGMYMGDDATDVFGKIKIGHNCFIGANSIILPGITLGDNTIVGAGSVVTKSFKDGNVVIAGNPAKIVTTTQDYIHKNDKFALNVSGLSFKEKKNKILNENLDKLLIK